MYPEDHHEPEKRGKPFLVTGKDMIVMNNSGIFFIFNGEQYYPSIMPLSMRLPRFDVVWEES
jgi:hypothetical protein